MERTLTATRAMEAHAYYPACGEARTGSCRFARFPTTPRLPTSCTLECPLMSVPAGSLLRRRTRFGRIECLERRVVVLAVTLLQRFGHVEIRIVGMILPHIEVGVLDAFVLEDQHRAAAFLAGAGGVLFVVIVRHPDARVVHF